MTLIAVSLIYSQEIVRELSKREKYLVIDVGYLKIVICDL